MYSLACSTLARNFSFGMFDSKRQGGHFRRHGGGMMFAGLLEQRDQPFDFAHGILVGLGRRLAASSRTALTSTVMVCATRSKTSNWSAMRKYITGVPSSSCGGRGTTGSTSWMNS